MHLTDLLGKWRWLLPGLCSCIHGTSVTTFIVDKIGVCNREAVGNGMHLTDLLGKWRWLLPGLCSCIHGTSVTTFIVAQVKADQNPQDTISYHKIDPHASRCVIDYSLFS